MLNFKVEVCDIVIDDVRISVELSGNYGIDAIKNLFLMLINEIQRIVNIVFIEIF